jgi:hypothetical protein
MTTGITGDFAALEQMLESLRKLKGFEEEIIPEMAEAVRQHLAGTIASGTDPYGTPWPPRKKGDGPMLADAMEHIDISTDGRDVIVRLTTEHYVRHNYGAVKGKTKRKIIYSSSKLPPKLNAKFRAIAQTHFERIMTGGSP